MEVLRIQKILSATHNEKMHNSHTEKVGNLLTEISHKILCDIATHDRFYSTVTLFTKLAIAHACSLLYL